MVSDQLGLQLSDKDLHFWIMGIIGICTFLFVFTVSKWLSKLRFGMITLSFFYTLTFMFVLVFAVEIQQAITDRGNMEFIDAIVGLWGFIAFFLVYIGIVFLFFILRTIINKDLKNKSNRIDG
ncbi:putative membrane protein YesL [Bacillus pakistanensis]|uniref:Membrane protein YesL n=1 Tax=Rossellomorea pakistanensis TaxID=992288 RepID=A0ABS2NAS0_9BACI|nr:hypothetical protein [Bacillus pakistanensis]MBM7584956.1 putative membrane protein YesL [Bacillus pakistanensis]